MKSASRRISTRILSSPPVIAFDASAVAIAQKVRGKQLVDRAMYGLSEAGNHSTLWHTINAIDALTGDRTRRRRAVRRSVIIATEQAVINGPVKLIAKRDRPIALTVHPHDLRTPRSSSFPSGHASASACAATLLTRDLGMAPLWWTLSAAVSWSRIHVGVHHASDVVAGLAAGRLMAEAGARLWPVSWADRPPRAARH